MSIEDRAAKNPPNKQSSALRSRALALSAIQVHVCKGVSEVGLKRGRPRGCHARAVSSQ